MYSVQEALYLQNTLIEPGFDPCKSVSIYNDNTGALRLEAERQFSARTKHVAIRYYFIADLASEGILKLHDIRGEDELADMFTNYLRRRLTFGRLQHMTTVLP